MEKIFLLKNVDSYIKVDSQVKHAYKVQGDTFIDRDNRMYSHQFPVLKADLNKLSITKRQRNI